MSKFKHSFNKSQGYSSKMVLYTEFSQSNQAETPGNGLSTVYSNSSYLFSSVSNQNQFSITSGTNQVQTVSEYLTPQKSEISSMSQYRTNSIFTTVLTPEVSITTSNQKITESIYSSTK